MQSIPWAMIWELFSRGKWLLIAGALGANTLPVLLEYQLSLHGIVDGSDPAQLIMSVMLLQLNIFMFGTVVIAAQGLPARLYATPIRTSSIVIWHFIPAMVLMFLQTALTALLLNFLFGLNWPIWGPALFAAVSILGVNAALWQSDKSGWVVLFLTIVASALGLWLKSRHGRLFTQPEHYWSVVTPFEVLTMILFGILSYIAAVNGVARSRCGEALRPLGIVAWIERIFDPPPDEGPAFPSHIAAQSWYVWRQKGLLMPASVAFVMTIGFLGWVCFNREPHNLLIAGIAGGWMLHALATVGAVGLGNCGTTDTSYDMGGFLGTRPISTRELSGVLLRATVKSVAYSWGIWIVPFSAAMLTMLALGIGLPETIRPEHAWWFLPLSILGPWVVASLGASVALTGRAWIIIALCCIAFPSGIAYIIIAKNYLLPETAVFFERAVRVGFGVLCVLATAGFFLLARRRSLIDSAAVYYAALTWVTLSVVAVGILRVSTQLPLLESIAAIGLIALALAPCSTVPLALAWNRVR